MIDVFLFGLAAGFGLLIPVGVFAVLVLQVAPIASRVETAAAFNVALTNGLRGRLGTVLISSTIGALVVVTLVAA